MSRPESEYTVLLLYPDYLSSDYGTETEQCHVFAFTPAEAVVNARTGIKKSNPDLVDPTDMLALAVYPGHLTDLNPER